MRGFVGRNLFLALMAVFLAAPLVIVTGVSFNGVQQINFPPHAPSFIWYETFFHDPSWLAAFGRSLEVATLASITAASIALPTCYAIWKYKSRAAVFLESIARLSFLLPAIVLSIVFLVFWSWLGHVGRIEDTILSHAAVFVTLPLATIGMGFRSVDMTLVEAAGTLGADEGYILRSVVRPIVMPYLISGIIFVFILSLNEYIIAYMVAGFEVQTLPIKVFNTLRMGFQPTMCVGAVLFMIVGIVAFSTVALIGDLPKLLGAPATR